MYFHCSLNSLLYQNICHSYTAMIAFHHLCFATTHFVASLSSLDCFPCRFQEAGTVTLKLKTSRSQNITAASSPPLCPGSLWGSGAKCWCWEGSQQCPNHSPAVLCLVQDLSFSWLCLSSSAPAEPQLLSMGGA